MKRILRFFPAFFCSLLLFIPLLSLFAQGRGGDLETGAVNDRYSLDGKQWAVFIAIDKYEDFGWPDLYEPVKDAKEIKQILQDHYIIDEWRELYDEKASVEGIRTLFRQLRQEVGKNDSVFVFHAGHGFTDEDTKNGAWIAADAGSNKDKKTGWISHKEVGAYLDSLPAKHVLLISDSCYSGDLLGSPSRGEYTPVFTNEYYRNAYNQMSRQVITSGASESVPDISEFARRLKNIFDRAEGTYIDALKIYDQVRDLQATNIKPRWGPIPDSLHHIDGSFIFFRKDAPPIGPTESTWSSFESNQQNASKGAVETRSNTIGTVDIFVARREKNFITRYLLSCRYRLNL